MERGGQLAQTLRALYSYMDDRLTESNFRKSPEGIHDAIRRLTILRDAWQEMLGRHAAQAVVSEERTSLFACG